MTRARAASLQMFTIPPAQYDGVPALRIALSTALPLTAVILSGKTELTLFATFAAFASIYGKNQVRARRFFEQALAGALILVSMMVGVLLSSQQVGHPVAIPLIALTGSLGAVVALRYGLHPPGALFFIFGAGAIGMLPYNHRPFESLALALVTVLYVLVLGLLWTYLGEGKNALAVPVSFRANISLSRQLEQGAVYFVAALCAGYAGIFLGSTHSYWAMVAAVSVLALPSVNTRILRAVERVAGTFLGVFSAAFVLSMSPNTWHLLVLIVLAQFIGQNYIKRNYAFAMVFITPQALFMIQLVHPIPVAEVMTDRLVETAIGSLVGVLAVVLTRSPEHVENNTVAIPALRAARKMERPVWRQPKKK